MGCCVSSNNGKSAPMKSNCSQQGDQEEETVKEVLSETPTVIPKSRNYTTDNDLKISTFSNDMEGEKHHKDHKFKKPIMGFTHPDDSSETACDNLQVGSDPDYVGYIRQMSPAKYRNRSFNGQRNVSSSPARRSDPYPGRVIPGPGRDSRGVRKDNGECSGRRSRSPAMRTENGVYGPGLGRSPSVRKTGKSPGRVRSELGDRVRKMEERDHGNGEHKWPPTCENESLENPLVSLECFIFL